MIYKINDDAIKRIADTFYPRWSENMTQALIETINHGSTGYVVSKKFNICASALYRNVDKVYGHFSRCHYIIKGQ